jgi:hypothetical protein
MSAWPPRDGNGGAAGVGKNLGILEIIRRQMIKSVGVLPVVVVILTKESTHPTRIIAQLFRWKTIEQTASHVKSSVLSILGPLPQASVHHSRVASYGK